MSRFYSSVYGDSQSSRATRGANKSIHAHVRGWEGGICIHGISGRDADEFHVYTTWGSNERGPDKKIGILRVTEEGPTWIPK